MRRPAVILALCLALGAAAPGAASAEEASAKPKKPVTVSGKIKLKIEVTANAAMPDGTEISIGPSVTIADDVYSHEARTFATIKVSGGKATYSLLIPYKWEIASAKDKITASANLSASFGDGFANANFSRKIDLPKNGKTTEIVLSGAM